MSETDVVLIVEGRASPELIRVVLSGLPQDVLGSGVVPLVLAYAPTDVALGTVFTRVMRQGDEDSSAETTCTLLAVTQEFGRPMHGIPKGWKTLGLFKFPYEVPQLVSNVREVPGWLETDHVEHLELHTRDRTEP